MRTATLLSRLCLAAAILIPASGCRNPFDPEADVDIVRFYGTDGQSFVETVVQAQASTRVDQAAWSHTIGIQLYNYSSVGVRFRSYTLVFRQVGPQTSVIPNVPPGQPIAALGGAAGRRYLADGYIGGLTSNGAEYIDARLSLLMLTDELFTFIDANEDTTSGGIDIDITLFGVDDNDHDVVTSGTFHIEVY